MENETMESARNSGKAGIVAGSLTSRIEDTSVSPFQARTLEGKAVVRDHLACAPNLIGNM
jgi:hypothetical protein